MKKLISVVIAVMLLVLISGCESADIAPSDAGEDPQVEAEENEIPIDYEDIKADLKILEPDSIGTVYMEAEYTNNSDMPITGYELKILLKDTNETTYLSTYDTVMPGEKSPKFESFGPETGNYEDFEILTLSVVARTEDGTDMYIDYDFKLNEATWW